MYTDEGNLANEVWQEYIKNFIFEYEGLYLFKSIYSFLIQRCPEIQDGCSFLPRYSSEITLINASFGKEVIRKSIAYFCKC